LLYLISKCALVIGRNRVTWRSINLASALMDVSLISLNKGTTRLKNLNQSFTFCTHLRISLVKIWNNSYEQIDS